MIKFIQYLEMAVPRETDFAKTYYHGTYTKSAAEGIMREGIKPPEQTGKKHKLTPVEGMVYLSPRLDYALIYAIGGDYAGHNTDYDKNEPYGYIFVVDGKQLNDIHPDEDTVGEMLYDLIQYKKLGKSPIHIKDTEILDKIQWLLPLAQNFLTPLQFKKVEKYFDFADLAVAGKKLNKYMTGKEKLMLIDCGAHLANKGGLKPKECFRIHKSKIVKLKPDGSNFFKLAEKVDTI